MTTKVWVINDEKHGGTTTYAGDKDPLEIPFVKEELSYLTGGYEDEREEFIADIERAKMRGHGSAHIEERFSIELQDLR